MSSGAKLTPRELLCFEFGYQRGATTGDILEAARVRQAVVEAFNANPCQPQEALEISNLLLEMGRSQQLKVRS